MAGRPVHTFEVLRTENLTPHIVRVVLGGSGFDTFTPNDYTDAYVKIVFVRDDVDVAALPQPLTLDSFNELPIEHRPTVRTYTVRNVDTERRELTIDFVVHGEHGVAGTATRPVLTGHPCCGRLLRHALGSRSAKRPENTKISGEAPFGPRFVRCILLLDRAQFNQMPIV